MRHPTSPLERAIKQAQREAALPAGEALAVTAALVLHNALADIAVRAQELQETSNGESPVCVYLRLCRRVDELLELSGSNGSAIDDNLN